jgi:hypothetical protein
VNDSNGAATAAVQGPNNKFYAFGQRTDSSWVGPITVGKTGIAYSDPALYINQSDGTATVVAQGPNNSLYGYGQRIDGSWVGPNQVGTGKTGIVYSAPAIAMNPVTGLGEAVAEGPKNSLYYYWQKSDGSWMGPLGILGGIPNIAYSTPSMAISSDGSATLLVQGPNNSMTAIGQRSDGSWVGPLAVNSGRTGYVYSAPSLALINSNGLAEAVAEGPKNSLYYYWQNSDGSWSGPWGMIGGNPNLDYSVPSFDLSNLDATATLLFEGQNNSLQFIGQRNDFSWVGPIGIAGGRTGIAY